MRQMNGQTQRPQRRQAAPLFEALEGRRLLSAASSEPIASDEVMLATAAPIEAPARADTGSRGAAAAGSEAAAFLAPGILHTEADFDRMREKVNAGAQPWLSGWNALISDGFSQTGWNPRPTPTVVRGGDGSNFGGMIVDMLRAYQTAVRWKVSGDVAYANQAVTILNAWSSTHTVLTGNADRFLASGLYAFGWAAAADIMRSYSGWAAAEVTAFQNYLINVYYPLQDDFLYGGDDTRSHNGVQYPTHYWANWDLANIEGMMAIGIFADRQDIYDRAVNYLYNGGGNGALDISHYYRHPGNLMQWQESGRDQGHTTLGMGLFGNIAQMAWNQGLDLFSYNNYQFLAAAEYIAKYNLHLDVPFQAYTRYNWHQTDISSGGRGHGRLVYELIYNHYVQRLGMAAPYSTQRTLNLRPEWRGSGDELGFGTLTYALDGFSTPQPPRGLTAAEKGAGNIQLDWFGGANVTSYKLYRAISIDGTYTLVASNITDLLSYTDRNLPPGEYYYKVTGVSGATETAASNIVSAISNTRAHTHLTFNENTGTTANDSTGNGHTGTFLNGASWTPGRTGSAVALDGSDDHVSLPEHILADADDFTISTWVYLNDSRTWSRIFDFGETRLDGHSHPAPARWMFLTPRNGAGVVEFATSTAYGTNKQWVTGNAALPTNQWVHVAVTLSDRVGKLYVNGVAVGANADMAFPPSQIRLMSRNWLGRSLYSADPYLNGKIDDFRIYNGAMNPSAMYTLATGNTAPAPPAAAPVSLTATAVPGNTINLSWPSVAGATRYTVRRSTTSGGPYTTAASLLTGTTFSDTNRTAGVRYYYVVSAYNNGGDGPNSPQTSAVALPPMPSAPANLIASAVSSSAIQLTWAASANAATYSVKRALTSGGPYTTIASGLTTTSYTDPGRTAGTTYYYVVSAVNASGESANSNQDGATPSDLLAHLKFDQSVGTTTPDSGTNGWNGTLVNGPLVTPGRVGNAVDLDGADDHVTVPAGVMSGVTNFTISTWVFQDAAANWARIFDFGTGTTRNMFLTPQNGANGRVRFAITTGGGGGEQQITGGAPLPVGAWAHVAVTLNGSVGILYVNGIEVGRNSGMTLNPNALGSTNLNYIGRSQYADPYFNGRVDDFRIYARALAAAEISALNGGNVPAAPASLTATAGDGQVSLSWPAVAGASSYTLRRGTSSGGPYTTIASGITSTSRIDTGLTNGTTYYYTVTASNVVGEGAASPQAAAMPFPSTFTGTAGDDEWVVGRSGGVLQIWIGDGSGTPDYQLNFASVTSLNFAGEGGNDSVTIDGSTGTAVPADGITFDGGDGDDTLVLKNVSPSPVQFTGGDGSNAITVDGGSFAFASDLNGASLQAINGASVMLETTQHLAGLDISNAATVTLAAGGDRLALVVDSLTIANGALDLTDNALIVRGGALAAIEAAIRSGLADGAWNGAGIRSSAAAAGNGLTALGCLDNAVLGAADFAGVSGLTGDEILVTYTYFGDADLDGSVTGTDYSLTDNGFAFGLSGWLNGDFDYSGMIDSTDYALIDNAFAFQTGPLA